MSEVAGGPPAAGRRSGWRRRWRPLRGGVLALLLDRLSDAASRRDWDECQRAGARLGGLAWRLAARDRRRTLAHLQIAFPDLDERSRAELGRACFRHLGTTLAELLHLTSVPKSVAFDLVSVEGWEHFEAARAARRPVLVLTGHCGNWELMGAALTGRDVRIAAIARTLEDEGIDRALLRTRAHLGIENIARGSATAPRQLLGFLRRGTALAVLIDQDTKVEGVWAPFFGRPAYTPSGIWTLGRRFDATVLPMFMARLGDGRHRLFIEPALPMGDDVVDAVGRMNQRIENHIRRFPEQWVWMHRRWRRRPPEELDTPLVPR